MVMIVLALLFFGTLVAIVLRRRNIGRLSSFATLLAAIMLMIWMQDHGFLPDLARPAPTRPAPAPPP